MGLLLGWSVSSRRHRTKKPQNSKPNRRSPCLRSVLYCSTTLVMQFVPCWSLLVMALSSHHHPVPPHPAHPHTERLETSATTGAWSLPSAAHRAATSPATTTQGATAEWSKPSHACCMQPYGSTPSGHTSPHTGTPPWPCVCNPNPNPNSRNATLHHCSTDYRLDTEGLNRSP